MAARSVFAASGAVEAARRVVHHPPGVARDTLLVPRDRAAATVAVDALAAELNRLPPSILGALSGAERNAAHLSDDRLQGLAELIQNADDLGARTAVVSVDEGAARLVFRHDGTGLTLHDVWGLAIPWLSLKVGNADQLGRFGIGLKTLHSLSEVLEVHQGEFHVRLAGQDIVTCKPLEHSSATDDTTFVIPFDTAEVATSEIVAWLERWGDAGLIFLRSLRSVAVVENGVTVHRLRVERGESRRLGSGPDAMLRQDVAAAEGRTWTTYSRSIVAPPGRRRAGKAQASHTTMSIAFPLFDGDSGWIHVGLPVRPIGLPFRISAQFDPLANRRDIADDGWNRDLIAAVGGLWLDAVLDQFGTDPARAWTFIPLSAEFDADQRTAGGLRAAFEHALMSAGRSAWARSATFADDGGSHRLRDVAVEAAELTQVLGPDDVRRLADRPGVIVPTARSANDRWRRVIADMARLGSDVPAFVDVADAVCLLEDAERPIGFLADLLAVIVDAELTDQLQHRRCLVLSDGRHVSYDEVSGVRVLVPLESDLLWDVLAMGSRLHGDYRFRRSWPTIRRWLQEVGSLQERVTERDALETLDAAGRIGHIEPAALTDHQVEALRAAMERLAAEDRRRLGLGIGQAIRLSATRYDVAGRPVDVDARPCEAYIIDREAVSWRVAAGKVAGLTWLHRRYNTILKAGDRRDGVGAQRLFRLLGAETAPRLIPHPSGESRYRRSGSNELGVARNAPGSPERRTVQMQHVGATYTLNDLASPHLDAVVADIANEADSARRLRRATALLTVLSRSWETLERSARVTAAVDNYSWNPRGQVDAWWLAAAAAVPWLPAADGRSRPPADLRIRTDATVALFGDDPATYIDDTADDSGFHDVLAALGVQGNPRPEEILDRLRDVRADTLDDPQRAADLASPLYGALASQVNASGRAARVGTLPSHTVVEAFTAAQGLVATNLGWRRPSVVLAGPRVFGDLEAFVPSVPGADRLWTLLQIRKPDAAKALKVLRQLHRRRRPAPDDMMIQLDSLRVLAASQVSELPRLTRSPVWVGDRWTTERPVYAAANPLIVTYLKGSLPVWDPGGPLAQLDSLVEPYGLTRLDGAGARVRDTGRASYEPALTQTFSVAVANLRNDLACGDPNAEKSLTVTWDELARFEVHVLPGLTIELPTPGDDRNPVLTPPAWLASDVGRLYVVDGTACGHPEAGAAAVASAFTGDTRRISHDWVVAWTRAQAGFRALPITSAAARDAEEKRARTASASAALANLAARPKKPIAISTARADGSSTAAPPTPGRPGAPRQLVELDTLSIRNEHGMIMAGYGTEPGSGQGRSRQKPVRDLRAPDASNPRRISAGSGRQPANYTAEELETRGLQVAAWVLGLDDERLIDIRHQRNVGADALDDLSNFYELKVHSGPIPDVIRLEASQVLRARSTEKFFLVVVGNLEEGHGPPEVMIIDEPLDQLRMEPTSALKLSGVLGARSLRYTLDSVVTSTSTPSAPQAASQPSDP